MKFIGNLSAWLLIAFFFVLIGGLGYAMFQTPGSVTVPVFAALLAFGGTLGVKYLEQKNRIEEARRTKQAEMYEQLVQAFISFTQLNTSESRRQKDLVTFFIKFTPQLLVHGSPRFIRAWNAFRASAATETDGSESIINVGFLLVALRADLGHPEAALSPMELLSTFINDLPKPELPDPSLAKAS